jgi:acetyltransferase
VVAAADDRLTQAMGAHPAAAGGPVAATWARHPLPQGTVKLADGRRVRIRPIRPSDAEALCEFDGGLCEASHRFRYLGWMRALSREEARAMATVDFRHRFALVATRRREGGEAIVADCRLIAEPDGGAELAIAVADDQQGVGLGSALIRHMLTIAGDHGIAKVEGRVWYENEHMIHVLRGLGFHRTAWEFGVMTFSIELRQEPASDG